MSDKATKNGISQLFWARSVAVVGASSNPAKLGHEILANIANGGYEGEVYPVNPKADEILGLPVYPTVGEIPANLDLVVVVVPARFVPGTLREAVGKGATAGIIISGGFRESGREDLEQELLDIVAETGIRLVGPNCQGINYRPNKLCASWPLVTASGSLAVISQSGTVAATLAGWAVDEGLGISATVSLGNQVDVCETDLIDFFVDDEESRVIALYLEGAKDGRRFLEAVKRAIPNKPIVALKSGRTEGGQCAAASHTRSLAGRDDVFDAACRQFGIVRAPDIESLYDSAKALSSLDLNGGDRVFTVTSSGGCGILATDEGERLGLRVEPLPPEAVAELGDAGLLPTAILANPLDLTVAPAAHFEAATSVIERHDLADIYLLIFGDPIPGATEVAQRLKEKVGARVVVAYLGGGEVEKTERFRMHALGIPVFPTPQRAIRAIRDAVWVARSQAFQQEFLDTSKETEN
jgi:acyl-CoA synthetase (NDP forming)